MSSRRLVAIFARWTLICTISAGPSFFWGCAIHHQLPHVLGMIAGIVVFILGYTMVESSAAFRRVSHWPHVRQTLWIGYGTRLGISIIFPVAIVTDMWFGMLAIFLVRSVLQDGGSSLNEASFLVVFITTLVQGTLLNLVLFGYMGLVWCIIWGVARLWGRQPTLEA